MNGGKKLKFIFITPFIEEDFFKVVKHGMEDACRALDVESVFTGVVTVKEKSYYKIQRQISKLFRSC